MIIGVDCGARALQRAKETLRDPPAFTVTSRARR
jgi:hypothetical protein